MNPGRAYLIVLYGEGFDIVTHYMKFFIQLINFAANHNKTQSSEKLNINNNNVRLFKACGNLPSILILSLIFYIQHKEQEKTIWVNLVFFCSFWLWLRNQVQS